MPLHIARNRKAEGGPKRDAPQPFRGLRGSVYPDPDRPIHIVDFNNLFSFTGGGVRTYHLEKLAFYRKRNDARYFLVFPSDRDALEKRGSATLLHLKAPVVPGAGNYRHLLNPRKLRAAINRIGPDLIEVGGPYLDPLLVRAAMGRRDAVLTGFWHADYPTAYLETLAGRVSPKLAKLAQRLGWAYARRTYGRYDVTFAAADSVVDELERQGIVRVMQTPLGVDSVRFHPDKRDEKLRRSVGADDEHPLVFFPHRLLQEKGINEVIQITPELIRRTGAVVVFAGMGPRYPQLKALLKTEPRAHHLGFIDDPERMARWMASADVVFALSAWETFGLSAVEALSAGVPLVGADRGAVGDWIRRSQAGVMAPHGDAAALLAAIETLLNDLQRAELGRKGRAFVLRHFTWEKACSRQLAFYKELIVAKQNGEPLPDRPVRL